MKPGYKQTELGPIPEDWEVTTIGELNPFVTSGSRGWAKFYSNYGNPFIRITNLTRKSIYLELEDLRHVNLSSESSEGQRTVLRNGDVLVSITADIGISGYVDDSVPKPAYINQHIALIRFDEITIDSRFVSYFLASESVQRIFRGAADQGAKAGLNLNSVRSIKIVQIEKREQTAIAASLSDMDSLLDGIDRLIAKKRDIKQATMQQLLTGKTRLPGFEGEWEVKQLREACTMKSGEGITTARINDHSTFPCYGGNGLRGFTTEFTHDGHYALIGRQGALCGNVLGVSGQFFASEHALVVTASQEIDIRWLTFVLGQMHLNCLDPCDHGLYKFGKLHRARQVLSSLLSGNELKHEHP